MKWPNPINVFPIFIFVGIWQIFLFYENSNIGGDLTREALTFLITQLLHLSPCDILSLVSWGCLLRRFLRPLL